ncbi:hypothetical protein MLD38_002146 [Melastoma candidum]|uniref:Uncharacterized protein n=1 Tax=Melastoma candidum TaxID=119954 RepID=A0ACB9SGT7_9MYRT|nr:hypothetical protein MLD38_002146 [Melastoma candidum]
MLIIDLGMAGFSAVNVARGKPVEILKLLQRELFSDIMKMRARQDKVEKIFSFQKSVKEPDRLGRTHRPDAGIITG